jgi:hypothetical protein
MIGQPDGHRRGSTRVLTADFAKARRIPAFVPYTTRVSTPTTRLFSRVLGTVVYCKSTGIGTTPGSDFHRRTGGRVMDLMTSDENPAYAVAILEVYGTEMKPPPTGRPGRPLAPYKAPRFNGQRTW